MVNSGRSKMGKVAVRHGDNLIVVSLEGFSGHYEEVRDVLHELQEQGKEINSDTVATEIARQKYTYTSLTVKTEPYNGQQSTASIE